MKFSLRATFDAAPIDLNGDSYLLIKRSDVATLFDGLAIEDLTAPMARQARKPRQQPPPADNNGHQKTPLAVGLRADVGGAKADEVPVSPTFADCVRIALRNVGPASIGDILQDLTDSEIQTDRQKVTVCLSTLRKQGDAVRQDDGKWRAA